MLILVAIVIIITIIFGLILILFNSIHKTELKQTGAGASCGRRLYNDLYHYENNGTHKDDVLVGGDPKISMTDKFGVATEGDGGDISDQRTIDFLTRFPLFKEYEHHCTTFKNANNPFTRLFGKHAEAVEVYTFPNIYMMNQNAADFSLNILNENNENTILVNLKSAIRDLGFINCGRFIRADWWKNHINNTLSINEIADLIMMIEECCGHFACATEALTRGNDILVLSEATSGGEDERKNYPPSKYPDGTEINKSDWYRVWAFDNNSEYVLSRNLTNDQDANVEQIIENTFIYLFQVLSQCFINSGTERLKIYYKILGNNGSGGVYPDDVYKVVDSAIRIEAIQHNNEDIPPNFEGYKCISLDNMSGNEKNILIMDDNNNNHRILVRIADPVDNTEHYDSVNSLYLSTGGESNGLIIKFEPYKSNIQNTQQHIFTLDDLYMPREDKDKRNACKLAYARTVIAENITNIIVGTIVSTDEASNRTKIINWISTFLLRVGTSINYGYYLTKDMIIKNNLNIPGFDDASWDDLADDEFKLTTYDDYEISFNREEIGRLVGIITNGGIRKQRKVTALKTDQPLTITIKPPENL